MRDPALFYPDLSGDDGDERMDVAYLEGALGLSADAVQRDGAEATIVPGNGHYILEKREEFRTILPPGTVEGYPELHRWMGVDDPDLRDKILEHMHVTADHARTVAVRMHPVLPEFEAKVTTMRQQDVEPFTPEYDAVRRVQRVNGGGTYDDMNS